MRLLPLLLLLLTWLPAAAAAQEQPHVAEAAIDGFIRPAFAAFAERSTTLDMALAGLCAEPGPASLAAARDAFGQTVTAWSRVELLQLGPLLEDNRAERVFFWPDRRGIGLRQVQGILAEEDASATAPETLREKSVAVQGLGALEYVLFGTGSEALATGEADFRCRYGAAIGGNLAAIAAALDSAWADPEGIGRRLTAPQESDPQYRSRREVLEALTGILAHGVEAIRDTRLLPVLRPGSGKPNPRAAAFWRSGLTVPSIRANFEGLAALFERSGIGRATAEEHRWVENGVAFEFANARRATELVALPIAEALGDEEQRRALDYLVILTQSLQTLLGEQLSAALGLSVGFSSLDGD